MNSITTTASNPPSSEPLLTDKLSALLDSGNSPVIGPKHAAMLQAYLDAPRPALAMPSPERVDNMIGRLATATKERKLTTAEHAERLDLYWRVLRDVPMIDLAAGYDKLLRTCIFMPTPAEVLKACAGFTAKREYRKSRARHLLWKHRVEYRDTPPPLTSDEAEELRSVLGNALRNMAHGGSEAGQTSNNRSHV